MLATLVQSWLLITAALVGLLLVVIALQALVVRVRDLLGRIGSSERGRTGVSPDVNGG